MQGEAFLPLIFVLVGWFVVNYQANKREDRKEARAMFDGARKWIMEIADNSIKYQCDDKPELALPIKSTLDVLETEFERVPNFGVRGHPLMGRLIEFQDAVTGGDFESESRTRRTLSSVEVALVLATRNR